MAALKVLFLYANCMMDNLIPVGASALLGALKSVPRSELDLDLRLFDTTFYKTAERPSDFDRVENLQLAPFRYEDLGVSIKSADVFEDFRSLVADFSPDLLMVSMVESTYDQALGLIRSLGEKRPYVVAGGVYAILAPEEVLANDCIDAVCTGEGERALVEFCSAFARREEFTATLGMWFKQGAEVRRNPMAPLVDLNAVPFLDFSLFEKERFYKPMQGKIFRMAPIEFSRGCPYRCSYCANHALERQFKAVGRWYRWKSMDRIFAEIEQYVTRYDIEFFYFVSESFLSMSKAAFDEFCERYAKYKIPFWFNTRPETLTPEIVGRLEEIGCFRMGIGLEHGNREFRRKMLNRNVGNETIVEACRIVEASGISYSINNIIGFPGETRELVFDTIALNRRIKPATVGTFVFTPFKGTDLYDYCAEHGYIDRSTGTGDLNTGSVLRNNTLSPEELRGLLRTFPLYVHCDPEEYPRIARAERFDEEGNRIFEELAQRYRAEHFRFLSAPGQDAGAGLPEDAEAAA